MVYQLLNITTGQKILCSETQYKERFIKKLVNGEPVWKKIKEFETVEEAIGVEKSLVAPEIKLSTDIIRELIYKFVNENNGAILTDPQILEIATVLKDVNVLETVEPKVEEPKACACSCETKTVEVDLSKLVDPFDLEFDGLKTWLVDSGISVAPQIKKLEKLQTLIPEIYKTQN